MFSYVQFSCLIVNPDQYTNAQAWDPRVTPRSFAAKQAVHARYIYENDQHAEFDKNGAERR